MRFAPVLTVGTKKLLRSAGLCAIAMRFDPVLGSCRRYASSVRVLTLTTGFHGPGTTSAKLNAASGYGVAPETR